MALAKGTAALTAVVFIVAARVLGDSAFGDFALGLSIAGILAIVHGWGTNRYSYIIAARRPADTADILATNLGLTVPLAALYLSLVWAVATIVVGREVVVLVSVVLGVDMLVRGFGKLLRLLFRVHDLYRFESITLLVERTGVVVAAGAVLLVAPSATALAVSFAVGRLLGTAVTAVVYTRRVGRIGIRFDRRQSGELLAAGTPIALRGALSSVNLRADTLILGGMRPSREVGWYGAVYKLLSAALAVPSVVLGSVSPHFSANFAADRLDVVRRLFRRAVKYLLVAGLFLGAVLGVLSEPVVRLVYGSEYAPAAVALRILSVTVVFAYFRQSAVELMDTCDERRASVRIFAVAVTVNVALNLALIPQWGYVGAAVATLVSEAMLAGALLWWLVRRGLVEGLLGVAARPLLAALAAGAWMHLLSDRSLLAAATGGVLYLVALSLLRVWDAKDLELARTLATRAQDRLEAWRPGA